ncbi:MAG TPA: glycosyltransferase family 2 protein [Anaerolineae bacterium]|nr:glycosyltransferase family 2 protein [Anaerolineae bacterium]
MPHISVMVSTFNRAHLVGRTIESVLAQEFQDWNLAVVDDASQDVTAEVVSRYCRADPRVRLLVNERNLGLVRNWNHCLDLAVGPLVQNLQSDDLLDPDYLGLVSGVFDEQPQLGFVAASCRYIDANDRIISPGRPRLPRLHAAGDQAVTALLTGGWPHVSSIVFRRECYVKLGKFDERIWNGPDVEMDTRLASRYDYYHLGETHTSFRRHATNLGMLNYLRRDFLQTNLLLFSLAYGYLSPAGLRQLGITDLARHVARRVADDALGGVPLMIAYDRPRLARYYLKEAFRLDPSTWRRARLWKYVALLSLSGLGRRIMQQRLRVSAADMAHAARVEACLASLQVPYGSGTDA